MDALLAARKEVDRLAAEQRASVERILAATAAATDAERDGKPSSKDLLAIAAERERQQILDVARKTAERRLYTAQRMQDAEDAARTREKLTVLQDAKEAALSDAVGAAVKFAGALATLRTAERVRRAAFSTATGSNNFERARAVLPLVARHDEPLFAHVSALAVTPLAERPKWLDRALSVAGIEHDPLATNFTPS